MFDLSSFRFILDNILSGEATETVIENIHDYLSMLGSNIRSGKIELEDFIIYKVRLNVYILFAKCSAQILFDFSDWVRTLRTILKLRAFHTSLLRCV